LIFTVQIAEFPEISHQDWRILDQNCKKTKRTIENEISKMRKCF